MNIAFIEPHLQCVGGIRRIVEMANRLKRLGHSITIYTPTGESCRWLPCNAICDQLQEMHKYTFDVAIFNLAEQYEWAKKANAKLKVFWVLAPEALYKRPDIPIAALKQDFFLLANSTFTVNYIKRYRPQSADVPIVYGGINPDHFKYDPGIKRRYTAIYYGSPRPWKGSAVIEAAMGLPALRNCGCVRMHGLNTPQCDMYKLYNSAEIYVSANQAEGFSFGQLEAMACGTAVVTTDDGGSRDYVRNETNALVVERNAAAISDAISRLHKNTELRERLVKSGLATASQEKFNWDTNAKILESILKKQLQI